MDQPLVIDANGKYEAATFKNLVAKLKTDDNSEQLFWRVAPDVAFNLQMLSYDVAVVTGAPPVPSDITRKVFADTLCGIPLRVEWDAKPNEIYLRDKYTAIGRVFNLPNTTI